MARCVTGRRSPENCLPTDRDRFRAVLPFLQQRSILFWCWSWSSNTLATWCKELTHWKRPWCWERSKTKGGDGDRGWDGWMASQTHGTWVSKLQEILKDREAWSATVNGVEKNWTRLSNNKFCFVLQFILALTTWSPNRHYTAKLTAPSKAALTPASAALQGFRGPPPTSDQLVIDSQVPMTHWSQ